MLQRTTNSHNSKHQLLLVTASKVQNLKPVCCRARALIAIASDPALLKQSVPPGLTWLGPLGPVLAKFSLNSLLQKYKVTTYDEAVTHAKLQELRGLLQKGGGEYFFQERLTWAGACIHACVHVCGAPRIGDGGHRMDNACECACKHVCLPAVPNTCTTRRPIN